LSEIAVPGLLSLKRRVNQAEAKVDLQTTRTDALETIISVTQTRLDAATSANASASAENVFLFTGDSLRELPDRLQEKITRLGLNAPRVGPSEPEHYAAPPSRDLEGGRLPALKLELIDAWQELYDTLFLDRRQLREAEGVLPPILLSRRDDFVGLFRDEINLVRAARNNAAHSKPLTEEEAAEAVTAARTLLRAWRTEYESLGLRRAHDDSDGTDNREPI
jgi:hypothetical protein